MLPTNEDTHRAMQPLQASETASGKQSDGAWEVAIGIQNAYLMVNLQESEGMGWRWAGPEEWVSAILFRLPAMVVIKKTWLIYTLCVNYAVLSLIFYLEANVIRQFTS